MTETIKRRKVRFPSGGDDCAAWHYPGDNGGCVVMAGGLAVTKEPGTDRAATWFTRAGYSVLAFDYRGLGESGGRPRQVVRMGEQVADWQAALDFAATLPGVDPNRLAVWGFSASGGHVFRVAASNPQLAAAICHSGLADGVAATPNALRHQTALASLRLTGRALRDVIGAAFGRDPVLVPLAGERGAVASLSTPDALNGAEALNPGNRYPDWQQEVAARSALRLGFYRPGRHAARVQCPLLVLVQDDDGVAPPGPAVKAGARAPRGEVAHLPGGHYESFLGGGERTAEILVSFLDRHVLGAQAAGTSRAARAA